jgi:hypothetical protein
MEINEHTSREYLGVAGKLEQIQVSSFSSTSYTFGGFRQQRNVIRISITSTLPVVIFRTEDLP